MKVSIIIAVYRAEKYIEKCLQSVAAQSYDGDIECLVVDDRGGDRSIEIANQFIESYKGRFEFRIISHERNLGASASRNTGIDNATGEYIYFLDNDDYIDIDCIKKLTEPLKGKKYDFIQGNFKVVGGKTGVQPLQLKTGEYLDRDFIILGYTQGFWPLTLWNKLLNLDFVKRNNLYFEKIIAEDNVWSLNLACCANNMYAVNEITYTYYIREGSIMTSLAKDWQRAQDDHFCLLNFLVSKQNKSLHIRNYAIHYGNGMLLDALKHNCLGISLYKRIKSILNPTPFCDLFKGQSRFIDCFFDIHYDLPNFIGFHIKKLTLRVLSR